VVPTNDGAVCTPMCDVRYTGVLSATCNAATDSWVIDGSCIKDKPFKTFKNDPLFGDKVQAAVNADTSTDYVTDNIFTDFSDTDGDDELDKLEISQHIFSGNALDRSSQAKHCLAVLVAVNSGACLEWYSEDDCGIELAGCELLTPSLKRQDLNYTIVTTLEYAEVAGANALTLSFFCRSGKCGGGFASLRLRSKVRETLFFSYL